MVASRLVLGTAQWGMPYGIANRSGPPSVEEILAMTAAARTAGVCVLDTACAYGNSEERIGAAGLGPAGWRIVTKTNPTLSESDDAVEARVTASVQASLRALRLPSLDTLLLHRPEQRTAFNYRIWNHLKMLRDQGLVTRLGISALEPGDAFAVLDDPDVAVIQVAASLLDQRLARAGFFTAARAAGKEVFVRSIFLQGAGRMPVENLPPNLQALAPTLQTIHAWEEAHGLARGASFLCYGQRLPDTWIITGCESLAQVEGNLRDLRAASALSTEIDRLARQVPDLPANVLNPARW